MIQSIDRAMRVLTELQAAHRMSLTELAARLKLAPSTTHGIVRSLVDHGMVAQDRRSSHYQLGPALFLLGHVYLDTLELRSKTIPWAQDLARRTRMAVRTGVLLGDDIVIIHHEPRPDGSHQMSEVGMVVPVHATALGKAVLAFLPPARQDAFPAGDMRSLTCQTITSSQVLVEQLKAVRSTGIAIERDESVLGESCIASPVFEGSGSAVGAIGAVSASDRLLDLLTAGDLVSAVARAVSRELKSQPSSPTRLPME